MHAIYPPSTWLVTHKIIFLFYFFLLAGKFALSSTPASSTPSVSSSYRLRNWQSSLISVVSNTIPSGIHANCLRPIDTATRGVWQVLITVRTVHTAATYTHTHTHREAQLIISCMVRYKLGLGWTKCEMSIKQFYWTWHASKWAGRAGQAFEAGLVH